MGSAPILLCDRSSHSGEAEDFHVVVTIDWSGILFTAIALHPPPPRNRRLSEQRNQELEIISQYIQTSKIRQL
ncbi:MAG: hypothetical protein HC769_24835 [Cyanobacteria bacterium CRU_2_1]|nr:hypothetical protein [Cyanobacteria bacterium CRU_2_1]